MYRYRKRSIEKGVCMKKKSITVIKQLFIDEKIDDEMIKELRKDERKGVQHLIIKYEKQKQKQQKLQDKFLEMMHYETVARARGHEFIAGVDEAGRGPLAGPVVAAAVILPADFELFGLDDSKQLTEEQRNDFFEIIQEKAISYSIKMISNKKIDEINILQATKLGMVEAIIGLEQKPDHILIDAVALTDLPCTSEAIIKGDAKSISIAAASILAKVTRDRIMQEIHKKYPDYGFHSHMGYGTKMHINRLKEFGITPYHRRTFAPVQAVIEQ